MKLAVPIFWADSSSVFDCSFDHIRAITKIRVLHESFRFFSVVLVYLFVCHLIHCIK